MRRALLCGLIGVTLGGALGGCFGRERDYREERREERREAWLNDHEGHPYRRARWHDEDVYRREDGRWYARQGNDWVVRAEVNVQ